MRTPRLFPHFWTRVCIVTQRLYAEYTSFGLRPLRPHLSNIEFAGINGKAKYWNANHIGACQTDIKHSQELRDSV